MLADTYSVSIHAPVRVRRDAAQSPRCRICFNSRTREGATDDLIREFLDEIVSIHAPVRVRLLVFSIYKGVFCFNSRTREGATLEVIK